jgi:hypothetical protein
MTYASRWGLLCQNTLGRDDKWSGNVVTANSLVNQIALLELR